MTLQLDLWALLSTLIGLLVSFIGAVFAGGRILLSQSQKQLDARFVAQEEARRNASSAFQERFAQHLRDEEKLVGRIPTLERELLELKAELPLHYVRREDYIRGQSVIEAKLDALAGKLEIAQLKGMRNG